MDIKKQIIENAEKVISRGPFSASWDSLEKF